MFMTKISILPKICLSVLWMFLIYSSKVTTGKKAAQHIKKLKAGTLLRDPDLYNFQSLGMKMRLY